MALRIVQRGTGGTRPLVLAFLVWPFMDEALRKAFGPGPCIVADSSAHGKETLADLMEYAHDGTELTSSSGVALVGYSMGCQRVRALRIAGADAAAYLLVDGTHASWPPQEWQIAWLRDLADQARRGRVVLVASHTQQVYTEELTPPETPFASTLTVLRLATGFPLDQAGPVDAPAISRDGDLWVYSYRSGRIDANAHAQQLSTILPRLAAERVTPRLTGTPGSQHGPSQPTAAARSDFPVLALAALGVGLLVAAEWR
jgi:hypothetical protein